MIRKNSNFRWMFGGSVLSLLGDQLTLIALPWLVLKLGGDSFSLGLALALMGIPRAVFMLVGGAFVDRYSPKRVLMLTRYVNTVLLAVLAALTLSGHASLCAVYVLAFAIGLAQAFSIPSSVSLVPLAIPQPLLQAANAAMMGMRQATMLAGPLLSALLFGLSGSRDETDAGQAVDDAVGFAFAFDALSFALSAWTLSNVKPLAGAVAAPACAARRVLRSLGESLATVWRDTDMRCCFIYWALVNFLISGTMQVALPILARERLDSAADLGLLMAAHGAGALLGMIASARGGKRGALRLGTALLAGDALAGLLLLPLGNVTTAWQGFGLMLMLGMVPGYLQIAIFTWIQARVPLPMMGRMMSIFMFIFMGLAPLSAVLAGWLLRDITLSALLWGCGGVTLLCSAAAWLFTPIRRIRSAA